MNDRIDHVAKAMTLRNNITPEEMGDPETRDWLSAAQVHATLALVEQQRIANEIAYVHLLEAQYRAALAAPGEFDESTRAASIERHGVVLQRIREGMGLS